MNLFKAICSEAEKIEWESGIFTAEISWDYIESAQALIAKSEAENA